MSTGPDVTATFCATLVDEWVRGGVSHVVVCPGSRSTPLALAVAVDDRLAVHVHHDERSGGFLALGIGLASGRPAVVVTTSGTAAAELHPAVVEAHHSRVPLIVATADRPAELQDVGAPQTIDQTHLFGGSVRWFAAPGVPDDEIVSAWRPLGSRSVSEAVGRVPGPVHLDLAFREPLVGSAGEPPPGRADGAPWRSQDRPAARPGDAAESIVALFDGLAPGTCGVILAGAGATGSEAIHRLAARLAWPVLADPRSGARTPGETAIAAADAVLRHGPSAAKLTPEVVLRLGEPPVSKVLNQWLDGSGARQALVHRHGQVLDPAGVLATVIDADPGTTCSELIGRLRPAQVAAPGWLAAWRAAEAIAQQSIDQVLAGHPEPTEPGIARSVLAAVADGSVLVASSSMPVRDLEWFGRPRHGVRVLSNRGANGIDGVTSTAVGAAIATASPTTLLIGDVAFLHDSNGLLGSVDRGIDLTVVVVDNDGGGIFSFLPQRQALPAERFERLFGTPHGVDLAALASAHGVAVTDASTAAEVGPAVHAASGAGGVRLVLVRTDRDANVAVHQEIEAAVRSALDEAG